MNSYYSNQNHQLGNVFSSNFTHNNDSIDDYNNNAPYYPMHLFIGIWELICGIVGALANGFVMHSCCTLIKQPDQDPHHHLYIFSLTLSNFLFNIIHSPMMFTHYALRAKFDASYCNILYFFTHLSTVASSLSLLWINLNQLLFWRQSNRYHIKLSLNRLSTFVLTAWLVSIGWALFFIFGKWAKFESGTSCHVSIHSAMVYVHFVIVFFFLPIAISLLISVYIYRAANQREKRRILRLAMRLEERRKSADKQSVVKKVDVQDAEWDCCEEELEFKDDDSADDNDGCAGYASGGAGFVFWTSLISAITCLPYRIAFMFYQSKPELWLARLSFGLFALMVTNATVLPFVTVLTLPEYLEQAKKFLRGR